MGEIALLGLVASSQTSKNFRNLEDLPSGKDSQLENPPFFVVGISFFNKTQREWNQAIYLGQFLNFTEVVTFRVTSGLKEWTKEFKVGWEFDLELMGLPTPGRCNFFFSKKIWFRTPKQNQMILVLEGWTWRVLNHADLVPAEKLSSIRAISVLVNFS